MRLLAHLFFLGLAFISFTANAAGQCPNGVLHVSSWNTIFDGTISDINGCVVKHDDNEKISTTPQAGTPIPDTPAGWTPPTGTQIQPTPPSPITAPQKSFVSPNYFDPSDCTGAGNQWLVSNNYSAWQLRAGTCTLNAGSNPSPRWTSTIEQIANPSGSTQNITFGSALAPNCGTGYTVSGSNCTATNSSGVPKPPDGKCTVIRTGNSFSADPQDPDCGSALFTSTGVTVTSTKVSTPTKSVTINSDGTTTFNQTITNSNSTTTISISNFSSAGINTGTSVQTYSGTGSLTSSTPNATVSGVGATVDVSALNKEATQTLIKTGIDTLHSDLTMDGATSAANKAAGQSEVQTSTDALVTSIQNVDSEGQESLFDEVGDMIKPFLPVSVACSPWTGSVIGKTFSFDWCPYIDKLTSTIGWLMALFSMFSIFQITTRED